MIQIGVKLIEGGIIPKKMHSTDACYDVFCREVEFVAPNKVICHLGFSTEIPSGYKAVMMPRSSFTHKDWVMQNSPAQIDAEYRNEWQMRFQGIPTAVGSSLYGYKLHCTEFPYEPGDRCGQFCIEKILETELVLTEELTDSNRKGGFGSTGNK